MLDIIEAIGDPNKKDDFQIPKYLCCQISMVNNF